jgi:hypothetical protein
MISHRGAKSSCDAGPRFVAFCVVHAINLVKDEMRLRNGASPIRPASDMAVSKPCLNAIPEILSSPNITDKVRAAAISCSIYKM